MGAAGACRPRSGLEQWGRKSSRPRAFAPKAKGIVVKHRNFLWSLFVGMALFAGCATQPPPYAEGVRLFLQEDYVAAGAELAPLAERGEPTAQYYTGMMRLKGVSNTPHDLDEALDLLNASARAGNTDALAVLVILGMNERERALFATAINFQPAPLKEGVMPDGTYFSNRSVNLDARSRRLAEAAAGGPVSLPLLIEMVGAIYDMESWPSDSRAVSVSSSVLREIDSARADRGDKYAAARLGNRYKEGLGVDKDIRLAFEWNLKAARTSPPPRNCVYQAPVGGGASSVYCYDAGAASAGVPKAILEVCRAYAEGAGVARNTDRAVRWCERAAEHGRWRDEAETILTALQA